MRPIVVTGVVLAGLVLAGTAGAVIAPDRGTRFPAIDALATKLAGKPTQVLCAYPDDWKADPSAGDPSAGGAILAYTVWLGTTPTRVVLSPRTCGYLLLLWLDPNDRVGTKLNGILTRSMEAEALLTLAHEAAHMSGLRNESAAECRGLDTFQRSASSLGVRYAEKFYGYALSAHRLKPPAYQEGCSR